MKAPSPACFATWQEHDVASHVEWLKRSKNKDMAVMVQLLGANWGYLVLQLEKGRWTVLSGEFDWDWTAMDAHEKAEAAWAKATGDQEAAL